MQSLVSRGDDHLLLKQIPVHAQKNPLANEVGEVKEVELMSRESPIGFLISNSIAFRKHVSVVR